MSWITLLGHLWAEAALAGLVVLTCGGLALKACRQPVHRARIVGLTILGALLAPAVGALPFAPRWASGLLALGVSSASTTTNDAAALETMPIPSPMRAMPREVTLAGPSRLAGAADPGPAPAKAVGSALSSKIARRPTGPLSIPWATLGFSALVASTGTLAGWWLLGQVMLLRVSGAARPAPSRVRDRLLAISGPSGRRVRLLESDRIAFPFTYTWARPTILLPSGLCADAVGQELEYALGHEWSHVERRDYLAWTLVTLAGLLLFYQPLYWWLRRQLRLSQDYLADDRAASLGSPEGYAAALIRMARGRVAGPPLPALGIVDRRSNLHRRVVMLVEDRGPLEKRCRMGWSLAAASGAAAVILVASGLRLDAAPPADTSGTPAPKAAQEPAKTPATAKPEGETFHYTGIVKSKDTGKPIAGATVVVRRSYLRAAENRVLQETRHTTAADGTYSFTIPPEQASERFLYIELDVEHPDYATRAGFGYSFTMIRKNLGLGERPFFESVELRPARPITGRIQTPEGAPAAGVKLLSYSRTDKLTKGHFEYGSFVKTKTADDGTFRMPITTPGQAVLWILPDRYAPEMRVLFDGKRGDLGTITLTKGEVLTGVALDVDGKPLVGLLVQAERERGSGPDFDALNQLIVSDAIERTTETDAEGRFTFDPLPPATYRVSPTDYDPRVERGSGRSRRELPGVFTPLKVTLKEGEAPAPLEVHALPHVVIEGRWMDSKGQPKSGWQSFVFGQLDGQSWHGMANPDPEGRFTLKVPHGLEKAQLDVMTNEHASALHRIGKQGPLVAGRNVKLGTLDHDVKDIEIVRYNAPIIVINATTQDGAQIKGFKASAEYTAADLKSDAQIYLSGGSKETEAIVDEQNDGRYRTSQLLPDREVAVTVTADGFAQGVRKLTLPEGKIEEVTFVLEPKASDAKEPKSSDAKEPGR